MKEKNLRKAILTSIFILLILSLIVSFTYITYQKNKTVEIEATVLEVYQGNIIVTDEFGMKYKLYSNDEYHEGDKILFVMKNPNTKDNITEGKVIKIETKSKSVQFEITDVSEDISEDTIEQKTNTNEIISNPESTEVESTNSNRNVDGEEAVLTYLNSLETQVDSTNTNSITASIKNGFITVVDFLFYDGTIHGKKFSELSETAKLKVLQIAFSIDNKIEKKFPNYKEEIKSTSSNVYTNLKSKILESYLNISTNLCQKKSDLCQSAKEGLKDLKTNFSLTWNFIKEISGVGLSKLKSWYEIWRESE